MNKTTLETIAAVTKNPEYNANSITLLMEKLNLNERGFAMLMNVSQYTVRDWINGETTPCSTSRRLMQLFDSMPDIASLLAEEINV